MQTPKMISKPLRLALHSAALTLALASPAMAAPPAEGKAARGADAAPALSSLTLWNFFSEGWDQQWAKRPHPGGAPDMALLRVQTNFLESEFRADYSVQSSTSSAKTKDVQFLNALVAWGFNRRFMFELITNEQWNDFRKGGSESGTGGAALARFQLVDTVNSSYALNLRVSMPNQGIGEKTTTLAPALAGWEDLTRFGLKRVGLYWHVQEETFVGPGKSGDRRNDMTYAVTLAKTWTEPDVAWFGNFTTFVETFGRTDLDGTHRGRTVLSVTPGIRTTLGHGHVFMAGVDLPVSQPRTYESTFRLTYIINF